MPLADGTAGFVKILRDRSAQHRAEEELRESEERFRVLATNIPQLVSARKQMASAPGPFPNGLSSLVRCLRTALA